LIALAPVLSSFGSGAFKALAETSNTRPAMESARHKPARFQDAGEDPKAEIGPSMRAMAIDQAVAACRRGTNQILAEQQLLTGRHKRAGTIDSCRRKAPAGCIVHTA